MSDIREISLWLTDRSRYTTGTGKCPTERLLRYHAGPTGYGYVTKGQSVPLATGTYAHQVLEQLFQILKRDDRLPTVDEVRAAIDEAHLAYESIIMQKGFRGLLASERSDAVVIEQKALIEGLIWAASRRVLPYLHETYRILEVETESVYVLDCTCGLGSSGLDPLAHSARGCQGIGVQLRQDVIAEHRISGNLAYIEGKTTGQPGDYFASQWETKPQLAMGTFGIVERYGKEITEHYILAMYKGRREKVGEGPDTTYRQNSPLVLGYCKPANPPLNLEEWLPSYQYVDDEGNTRRASRQHVKRPTWEYDGGVEAWVRDLPDSVVESCVYLVGPLNRQDIQIARLKRQIVAEERLWQRRLWAIHEAGWTEEAIDDQVPASWDCARYGARHTCEFVNLCFKHAGSEDPIGSGQFVPRRPHHASELETAIALGLLPESAEEEEVDE